MNYLTDLTFLEGGKPVFFLLIVLFLIAFFLFLERVLFLHRGQIRATNFLNGLKNILRDGRIIEALTVCEETPGPVAATLKAGLLQYGKSEEHVTNAMYAEGLAQIPFLERRISSLSAIARAANLLGLIGTVLGLYQIFADMRPEVTYLTFNEVAQGIGPALLSILLGLMVALFCYLSHHFLSSRVKAIVHDMEWSGHYLCNFLYRELPQNEEDKNKA